MVGCAVTALAPRALPAEYELERRFALGVYWPWERTKLHAEHAGMEFWEFVDHLMGRARAEWHCNVVWFVNGPSEPARVCDIAEKHGLLVLCESRLTGLFVHGLRGEKQLASAVEKTVTPLAGKKALGAHVLKDEAKCLEKAQMESYRQALAAVDPERPAIIVTMTGHTEPFALDTGFPIVCTDIYHFGGTKSPAIPNPSRVSQRTYRGCINALTDMTRRGRKVAWSMPQAFADPWGGPYWVDRDGNMVLEPGSYWHWRMPSVAETRWQIWDAVRGGCRGVVFFAILLGGKEEWTPDQGEMPEKMRQRAVDNAKRWPTVKERINTGEPLCLTYNGGRSTPQVLEMGRVYGRLAPVEDLLVSLRPARIPAAFAAAPAALGSFRSALHPADRLAVVVNDDLEQAKKLELLFASNTASVTDVLSGQAVGLTPESIGQDGLLRGEVTLDPGGGTILRVSYRDGRAGFLLYGEDFSLRAVTAKLTNCERRTENRGFGMGRHSVVRKTEGTDAEAAIELGGLDKHSYGPGSPLATALHDVAKGKARVYLKVDGACPEAESIVVRFVDKDGNAGWNKTNAYHLPVSIPADTSAVRIRLADDASVSQLRLWRVDTE